jgi:hypothetical protein
LFRLAQIRYTRSVVWTRGILCAAFVFAGAGACDNDGRGADPLSAISAFAPSQEEAQAQARVFLESAPPGASVREGQKLLGTTPVWLSSLEPGLTHTLRLELEGYEPREIEVRCQAGEARELSVALVARRD